MLSKLPTDNRYIITYKRSIENIVDRRESDSIPATDFPSKLLKMKHFIVGTVVLVLINSIVESQDCCQWSSTFDSIECGLRQPEDSLLFNDVRTSNWTLGIQNRLDVQYQNVHVSWWRAELPTVINCDS